MLNLTTLERIKTLFGTNPGIQTNARDPQIEQLITQVSRQIQRWINVDFQLQSYDSVFFVDAGQRCYILKSYPVVISPDLLVVNGSTLLTTNQFDVTERGILWLADDYDPEPGNMNLRVHYIAGVMQTGPDDLIGTDYEDLTLACEAEVLHTITRAPHLGATSLSLAGGSRSFEQPVKLLPQVTELIYPFRRA